MEGELTRPWSDLPQELILIIVKSLASNESNPNPYPDPIDIITFRSVCTSWRSSCPRLFWPSLLTSFLPLTVACPFSHIYKRGCSSQHYSSRSHLSVTVVFSLRRPVDSPLLHNNFLLFVDEYAFQKLKIRQPFSRASYTLPIVFPTNLNLSDFHATEVSRFYNLSYLYRNKNKMEFRSENVNKVVFPSRSAAAVVLFDRGKLGLVKFYSRIKTIKHSRWYVIHDGKGFQFDDIVNCKGRVLGVDRGGRVYEIGQSSSEIKPIFPSSFVAGRLGSRKRLVESLGELYLVVRCNVCGETKGSASFKVYELNVERKWVEINSIGDRVFFIGVEFSFSVLAQQVPCQKNCILFKHQSFKSCSGDQIDHSEVFVHPINVYHLDDASHDGAYPDYSSTLWPPPDWIRSINRLERLREVAEDFDDLVLNSLKKFKRQTWRDVQRLQKMLNRIKEKEQKFFNWETRLQDTLPMKGRSASTDIWIQMNKSLLRTRIYVLGTEWQGCLDEIQNAMEHTTIDQGLLVNEVRDMFVKHNAVVFKIEECVSGFICKYRGVDIFQLLGRGLKRVHMACES